MTNSLKKKLAKQARDMSIDELVERVALEFAILVKKIKESPEFPE